MAVGIVRRQFISALGGATVAWPLAARAQQSAMPAIGILGSESLSSFFEKPLEAFRDGLGETGYVVGKNASIEYRWAEGQRDRLQALAAGLVDRRVAVIVAVQGSASAIAAKDATTTIPIVFATGGDPVKLGLVASLNNPRGNITGISFLLNALGAKRLELLHTLLPDAKVIGLLTNPNNPNSKSEVTDMQSAARSLRIQLVIESASNEVEIDSAFVIFARQSVNGFINTADVYFNSRYQQIVALAARYGIPAIYHSTDFSNAGGLMSYGTSISDAHRLAGVYAGRILRGEKPADLPVQESVKVELIINLKTAEALGITFPLPLLGRADEVIE